MAQSEKPTLFNTARNQVKYNFLYWVDTVPARHIDRFFVLLRWVVLIFTGIPSLFGSLSGSSGLSPIIALALLLLYNIPVSLWLWFKKPLRLNRVGWLLLGDTIIATVMTLTTGGVGSFFFILFMLVIAEAALTLRWQPAIGVNLILAALQLAVTSHTPQEELSSFVAYVAVSKFVLSLLVGGIVVLFAELLRRQETERQKAAYAAERMAALNAIFVQLGEAKLNLAHTLKVVLESTHILPNVAFSMVLLPRWNEPGAWRIAASTTDQLPADTIIPAEAAEWLNAATPIFFAGEHCELPLPSLFSALTTNCITGVMLRSDDDVVGALVVGQRSSRVLTEDEQAFLKSLALEAGLAVRNARTFAREKAHVQRLEEFRTMQATFFSAIGHELKTPLAVLKMLAPSLPQLPDLPPETQTEITDTITQNLDRLENLIRDLLDSSRLEAGAITLHPRPVDLAALVYTTVKSQQPLLAKKNQQYTISIADALPSAWIDPRHIEHVLSNLIQNAAKFAPPDSKIEISVEKMEAMLQVCVHDAGDGVPVTDRELIFNKFYTTNTDKALAGVGLGLFICRELVTRSGGKIWVEDSPAGGSSFCFTVPTVKEETDYPDGKSEQENFNH